MQQDIWALIAMLDYNYDIHSQQDAIKQLLHIDDQYITLLIQSMDKRYWENSAKVIKAIGYPRNKLAIPGLLQWMQDMNWPGAWIAMETLQGVDISFLMIYLESAVKKAMEESDEMWIMALKELAINRLKILPSQFENQDLYKTLEQSE